MLLRWVVDSGDRVAAHARPGVGRVPRLRAAPVMLEHTETRSEGAPRRKEPVRSPRCDAACGEIRPGRRCSRTGSPLTTLARVVDEGWLTTGEAGRLLGLQPARVREWAILSRLTSQKGDDGTWWIDPVSVALEAERIGRASWWRRDGLTRDMAGESRRSSTKRLLEAAFAWRGRPDDPAVLEALRVAIDDRRAREVGDRPGGQRRV